MALCNVGIEKPVLENFDLLRFYEYWKYVTSINYMLSMNLHKRTVEDMEVGTVFFSRIKTVKMSEVLVVSSKAKEECVFPLY